MLGQGISGLLPSVIKIITMLIWPIGSKNEFIGILIFFITAGII